MVSLASRLARIEARRPDMFKLIVLHGGMPGEPQHAVAGMTRWERNAKETLDEFVERVRAAAKSAGHDLCVVGGLP